MEPYSHDISCTSNLSEVSQQDWLGHSPNHGLNKTNFATLVNAKYKGKFVYPNVVNSSRRDLTSNEISPLSKGRKFVPSARNSNKARIKEELKVCGRKLRLMWHELCFRNDEGEFSYDRFKKKSKFDLKRKDAAIEQI